MASEDIEERNTGEALPHMPPSEAAVQAPAAEVTTQAGPRVEGRRTQLRIVKENIKSLSKEIGNFRKSHEVNAKRLEEQIASLRKELTHARSKDVGNHAKSHEASSKRLEKQVATLRNELSILRSNIAKDAARGRARQEAMLSKILSKISRRPSTPTKRSKKQ